jgi:hypothetical protein
LADAITASRVPSKPIAAEAAVMRELTETTHRREGLSLACQQEYDQVAGRPNRRAPAIAEQARRREHGEAAAAASPRNP